MTPAGRDSEARTLVDLSHTVFAVPVKVRGLGTFPVRAFAVVRR